MDKKDLAQLILILLMFVSGIYLYPLLPPNVPTHWGPDGRVDGYGPKGFTLILIPALTLIIYLAMTFIPYIMVYKENFKRFEKYYDEFKLMMTMFFALLYTFTLLPNFGFKINMNFFMIPVMAILFYYIGHMMPKFKRNYFIGIRTPWTLASEEVWNKTHKKTAWIFKIGGLFFIIAAIFNKFFIWIIIGYIISLILYIFIYSYVIYKKEGEKYEKEIPTPKKQIQKHDSGKNNSKPKKSERK